MSSSKACFAPPNAIAHASAVAGHRSCDVANGGRVRPANVPNNAGISAFHGGQNFGHPLVAINPIPIRPAARVSQATDISFGECAHINAAFAHTPVA